MEISEIVKGQKDFFDTGQTKDIDFRIRNLKKLKNIIKKNEKEIYQALRKDLGKSSFESYITEIGLVYSDLNLHINKLPKWAKKKRVRTPLIGFLSKSYIINEPYGQVLIMSPWNYPFQLNIMPLIGAIAGGNCVVIKTSEYSVHTSRLIEKLINDNFDESYISVVRGGKEENQEILEEKFDYIFFTGSVHVGKVVMKAAAEKLTPLTLELGGKSPCIVDDGNNLDLYAKRIVWGKLLNAGQTCIAPDYILVKKSHKKALIERLIHYIKDFYGKDPLANDDYPKIINDKHFERLSKLMDHGQVVYGGGKDSLANKIQPTIITSPIKGSELMNEEIFGPILPIIGYDNIGQAISIIKNKDKPLALYLFSEDKKIQDQVVEEISFGGGCINGTIMHFTNSKLGFGGVGKSGFGSYHGKHSYETFSHKKGLMERSNIIDIPIKYPPASHRKLNIIKKILK